VSPEHNEIEKAVMGIVTDSGSDIPENVYAIHKLFRSEAELKKLYEDKKGKYKELKEALAEDIKAFITPLREKRKEIIADEKTLRQIIENGGEKARDRAEAKMKEVREKVGIKI